MATSHVNPGESKMAARDVTKPELAQRLGCSIRAVEHWLKRGMPNRLERRGNRDVTVISLADADAWLAAMPTRRPRAPAAMAHEKRRAALDEAELRKRIAQAGKLEIDLALKRGEILRAEEVEAGRVARVQAVAAALEALPARAAPVLVGRTAQEIQAVLADEVRRIRMDFAGEPA